MNTPDTDLTWGFRQFHCNQSSRQFARKKHPSLKYRSDRTCGKELLDEISENLSFPPERREKAARAVRSNPCRQATFPDGPHPFVYKPMHPLVTPFLLEVTAHSRLANPGRIRFSFAIIRKQGVAGAHHVLRTPSNETVERFGGFRKRGTPATRSTAKILKKLSRPVPKPPCRCAAKHDFADREQTKGGMRPIEPAFP